MTFIAASDSANCVRLEALILASPTLGLMIHNWSAIALPMAGWSRELWRKRCGTACLASRPSTG